MGRSAATPDGLAGRAELIEQRRLPANIEVIEFYLEPGAWLGNEHLQQRYLSSN